MRALAFIALTAVLCGPLSYAAQATDAPELPAALEQLAQSADAQVRDAYAAQNYHPYWLAGSQPRPAVAQLLESFTQAAEHGLDPQRYRQDELKASYDLLRRGQADTKQLAAFDVGVSEAAFRYAHDLHQGAVTPRRHEQIALPRTPLSASDVLNTLSATRDAQQAFEAYAPQTPVYHALKQQLVVYRALAARGEWPRFVADGTLKPGMHNATLGALETILLTLGDLPQKIAPSRTYDGMLVEAVKHFQARHGLTADGAIGKETRNALNTPPEVRAQQIVASLERLRWTPEIADQRYLLINLPAFEQTAYDHAQPALSMRVIVGKPDSRTPVFSNAITAVNFNPTWGVPHKIASREMLPKLRRDPAYLTRAGFTMYDSSGGTVDPQDVAWEDVSSGNFPYRLRQRAGADNALGKIKFFLPDSDDIYLHSTSKPQLFAKDMRSLSHGCIRVEKPRELAHFALLEDAHWTQAEVDRAYDGTTTRSVSIAPLPVHVVYWTAWVDAKTDTLQFRDDVYAMDKPLATALLETRGRKGVEVASRN